MTEESWLLPGPRRFIGQINDDILDGKCVIVNVPECVRGALASRLTFVLRQREQRVDLVAATLDPLNAIATAFPEGLHFDSLGLLLAMHGSSVRTLLVQIHQSEIWNVWREFIASFHRSLVRFEQNSRPTLIAFVSCIDCPICEEVALTNRSWQYVWGDSDAVALAENSVFRRVRTKTLYHSIAVSTIAKLAIWDEEAAAELGKNVDAIINDPTEILRSIGVRRGWSLGVKPCISDGTAGFLDGSSFEHSAWLALATGVRSNNQQATTELQKRRWHAQAVVLLPWIEEKRLELLEEAGRFVPTQADDVLEIGPLAFHLNRTNAPKALKDKAHLLRRARNEIAHLRILNLPTVVELDRVFAYK